MREKKMSLRKFQALGNRYCDRYLKGTWDNKELAENWWTALRFFLNHAFMRGRRDELSEEYYRYAILALTEFFGIPEEPGEREFAPIIAMRSSFQRTAIEQFKKDKKMLKIGNSVKHPEFRNDVAEKNELIKCFLEKRVVKFDDVPGRSSKTMYLGLDRDLMMVLDVLRYLTEDKERSNIYNYLCTKLATSGVEAVNQELKSIFAIGDKLAAFIIRDVGLLNADIKIDRYEFAFPVDTWVFKIAKKLGYETNDLREVKNRFISECMEEHLDPLKVAAGLWYLGFNSLDIVLDNLEYITVND
jgi:hypothetical protein